MSSRAAEGSVQTCVEAIGAVKKRMICSSSDMNFRSRMMNSKSKDVGNEGGDRGMASGARGTSAARGRCSLGCIAQD